MVAATVANVNRPKGARAYHVTDFVPEYGKKDEEVDGEALTLQQLGMWRALKGE